jgi:integrase
MLPQCSHITRKRGIYYYRRRLPRPSATELVLSLRTRSFRRAEYLANRLDLIFSDLVARIVMKPDLQAILREHLKQLLDADLEQHLQTPAGSAVYSSGAGEYEDPVAADLALIGNLLDDAHEALAHRDIQSVAEDVVALVEKHGLPGDCRVALALGLLRANIQYWQKARERVLGGISAPIVLDDPARPSALAAPEPATPSGPLLSQLLPDLLEFMTKDEGWRGQTLAQNGATYREFIKHCGDLPVQAYSRRDLTSFYDVLRKLPRLYAKKPQWRGLPLKEIVESTQGQHIERITLKTVKRHFSALGRLFTYFKKRGEYVGENPAHGFDFPTKGRANEGRQMWQGAKLAELFSSPAFAGCLTKARRSRPGDLLIKDEKYWLPILGLYHGNRLEEFAQLRREDVCIEGAIRYFNITDDGERQLKNAQSRRRVPIHPAVLKLGFVEYVDRTAPQPGDLVFPLLSPGGPDNKLGFYFTKWFSTYRKAIGIYEKGLDYHSFRHGVTTKLYAANVQEALVDELTGHEGKGTSRKVYKKDMPLPVLLEAISKVEWPEINLDGDRGQ